MYSSKRKRKERKCILYFNIINIPISSSYTVYTIHINIQNRVGSVNK